MEIDNWVNLNDVYVSANGGSVNGDLGVKGTLTVDDKTGNNTTYDVANEITALRDSTSKLLVGDSAGHITFSKSPSGHYEIWFNTDTGDNVCIYFSMTEGLGVYDGNTQAGFNYPKP